MANRKKDGYVNAPFSCHAVEKSFPGDVLFFFKGNIILLDNFLHLGVLKQDTGYFFQPKKVKFLETLVANFWLSFI